MVLAVIELVSKLNVDIVEGRDVKDPVPGAAPLMLLTHNACVLIKGVRIEEW